MKSDLEIAQEIEMQNIASVAENYGISADELEMYGKYKAKLSPDVYEKRKEKKDAKLVLVTARKDHNLCGAYGCFKPFGEKSPACRQRTKSRPLLRHKGRRGRRGICTARSDGGFEPPFYRGFPCYYCSK